jgi:hypothetical protein
MEHGLSEDQAISLLKEASPQSAASFMENYKGMSPAGRQNLQTNPNVNPVAHKQLLSGMNWQAEPMTGKAKALLTPEHPQNLVNRAARAATGGFRFLAGDNPANVEANFKKITPPQPNRAMLQY